jgi:hypothetical protein
MALVVEEDEAFDPVDVGLLSLITVVPEAEDVTDLVEEFRFLDFSRNRRGVKVRG